MYADYHLHSEYSDDSEESIETQIKQAIKLGLDEICLTDHVDYGIKSDWDKGVKYRDLSGLNIVGEYTMNNVNYPKYFKELNFLKEKYKDKIKVKKGLETSVQTITIPDYERLWNEYQSELDFLLLSMHEVDNKELWTGDFQKGKSQKEYNEAYYKEILKVIKQYKHYSVLAHLDLIVRYDKCGVYDFNNVKELIAEILKIVIADGKGIELNTSSWHYGLSDTQPSKAILKLYKDLGGRIITIGSDAHKKEYIADHFKDAYSILKELGYKEFCTYERMEPIFHELI